MSSLLCFRAFKKCPMIDHFRSHFSKSIQAAPHRAPLRGGGLCQDRQHNPLGDVYLFSPHLHLGRRDEKRCWVTGASLHSLGRPVLKGGTFPSGPFMSSLLALSMARPLSSHDAPSHPCWSGFKTTSGCFSLPGGPYLVHRRHIVIHVPMFLFPVQLFRGVLEASASKPHLV